MSGVELLFGLAATEASAGAAATAATSGLIGSGGAFSLASTATSLGALGGVVGAAGALSSGAQQSALSEYNAKVSEANALATKQASLEEEDKHRQNAHRLLSDQAGTFAASGVDLEGSPLEIMSQTAAQAERDAITIRNSGSVAEAQQRSQAAMDRLSAKSATSSSYWKAGSSLLTGVSSMSRIYGGGKTATVEG